MQHHFTLKRDSPFCLDAFTPTMAALLFFVPVTLRENCREVTSSCCKQQHKFRCRSPCGVPDIRQESGRYNACVIEKEL